MNPETEHLNIIPTPTGKCSVCGFERELRPYGKKGAWVCFHCGMKDEPECLRQMEKQFFGKPGITVIGMPSK